MFPDMVDFMDERDDRIIRYESGQRFQVGDRVWINPLATYDIIKDVTANGCYRLTRNHGLWSSGFLISRQEREYQQKEIIERIRIRQQYDRTGRAALALMEPERYLFDSDLAYEEAYVIWAAKWWQYGDMPYMVRYWRMKYMRSHLFVLKWS